MATRIIGSAGAKLDLTYFLDVDLADDLQAPFKIAATRWSYGTGAYQVNCVYAGITTLTDGSNTTLDLYESGSLLDVFKRALTMAAIKFLYIRNNSPDSILLIGGGAVNDLLLFADTTDKVKLSPGGIFLWTCPTAAGIVTTANKNLKLEDDGSGEAGNKPIHVIAMGLD